MRYTTPVPNEVFDVYLRDLKPGELKVLLVVVRQTLGYLIDKKNKQRRKRVWLSQVRLSQLTGLSRKAISQAITGLINRNIITVTDEKGNPLMTPNQRKYHHKLFFGLVGKSSTHSVQIVKKGNKYCVIR
ncbi:MAG: replication protein [Bacteroidia bacterium]|nr:replication protein [Bacteroidia bacterium]